jgi:hypothetical protein
LPEASKEDDGRGTARRSQARELVYDDESHVIFRVPREDRWLGIGFMVAGLLGCVLPVIGVFAGEDDAIRIGSMVGLMGCVTLGGFLFVAGSRLGLRVDEIRFDPVGRSYTCRFGFPWSTRRWEGAIDEILCLDTTREAEHTGKLKSTVWRVRIVWHDVTRQPIVLTEFSHKDLDRRQLALEVMIALADRINVAAFDERGNRVNSDPAHGDS